MATAYTYAPEGHRARLSESALEHDDERFLGLEEQVFRTVITDAASGDTHTITLPWACRVLDAWAVAGGTTYKTSVDTVTLSDGTHDITDALNITESTNTAGLLDRAAKIVPDYATLQKGDTLVWTVGTVTATDPDGEAYVRVLVLPTSGQ